ncbi:MAG: hypothetical protein HC849_33785 [Oscillatoriales cyanobacterium RU_3_3]|nr:hypothetical protein [Microcoleus sp. SU_5_6]NJM63988.1 hypothetical protein [Oscillatoriales cyanobacterium RU_3_3]NJR20819.1 hypothetical protein [Richelia sp. CSU_2_1]
MTPIDYQSIPPGLRNSYESFPTALLSAIAIGDARTIIHDRERGRSHYNYQLSTVNCQLSTELCGIPC